MQLMLKSLPNFNDLGALCFPNYSKKQATCFVVIKVNRV